MDALARAFDLVVLDVPRWLPGQWRQVVVSGDVLLLVTTADLRGVASARRVRAELASSARPILLVVRTARSGIDPEDVADLVPAPVAATLRHDRRVAGDAARGELVMRAPLRRTARRLLTELATAGGSQRSGQR
jgi:Flp pilus assembly CpaE family ATPase